MKMLTELRLLHMLVTVLVVALLVTALLTNMAEPLYSQSTAPSAPTNVTIAQKSVGARTVTVSWDSLHSVGYYLVRWRAAGTPTLNQGIPFPWQQNPVDLDVSEFGDWVFRVDACAGAFGEWYTHDHSKVCNGVAKQVSVRQTASATPTPTPTPTPMPLPKPTGLTLAQSETSGDVNAEWDEVDNATRYKIRWRDSESRLGDHVYVTDTEYTVSLTEYDTWTIRVEACHASSCGEPTSKAITTKHPWTPSLSYLRQQLPGKGIVEWEINRVLGPYYWNNKWRKVGEDVSEYREPFWQLSSSLHTLSKTTVLPESGEWILRVEACEYPINDTPFCVHNEFTIDMPPQFDPSVTGLTLSSEPGTKVIRASWDSVHESVSSYEILYRASDGQGGRRRVDATEANISVPSYGSWEVQVAPCAQYCHPFTDVVTVSVRRTPPVAPTGITLSQDPAGSLRLLVGSDTVTDADNYKIRWREAGPGNELNAGITVSDLGTDQSGNPVAAFTHPITVSGYGTWVVRVDACNEEGCTGASKTIKAEPLAPDEEQQSEVEITRVVTGDGRFQVDWTYSGEESELNNWRIWYKAPNGQRKDLLSQIVDKSLRTAIVESYVTTPGTEDTLENGVGHTILVQAFLKDGTRRSSGEATVTPGPRGKPAISEVAPGKNKLTVSWTYQGDEFGLTDWLVLWTPSRDIESVGRRDYEATGDGTSRSFVIDDYMDGTLANDIEFTVWVTPLFDNGAGTKSDVATGTPVAPLPDVTPVVTLAEPYDSLAHIEWTFAADYGDSYADLTGWKICHRAEGTNDASCDVVVSDDSGMGYFHTIDGLENGKTYFVYVHPMFEGGREGGSSDDYQVSLPKLELPGKPQNLRIEPKGNKYFLHWSAPEDDGGTYIVAYLWRGGSQHRLAQIGGEQPTNLDITRYLDNDGGVDRSKFYTFRVRAQNSVGRGPVATVTLRPHYFPPVIDSEVARFEDHQAHDRIGVKWSTIEGAVKYRYNLSDVTSGGGWDGWKDVSDLMPADHAFECWFRDNDPSEHMPADCSLIGEGKVGMQLQNLTPGNTYRVKVRAKTAEGIGPQSANLEFVAGGRPPQPRDLWAYHYSRNVQAGGNTYTTHYVLFDWSTKVTNGRDAGDYWQVRHNLSGTAGGWSRWITLAWERQEKGPLSSALPIRTTVPTSQSDEIIIGTHLAFPQGAEHSQFIPGVSKFQVRRGHVDTPAVSTVGEVELKSGWRTAR